MTVTNVTWTLEDPDSGDLRELKTCNEDCLNESLEMEYTTETLWDSGVFEFWVDIYGKDEEEDYLGCSGILYVLGEFGNLWRIDGK